jgi:fatty-acyl-CoA synthase
MHPASSFTVADLVVRQGRCYPHWTALEAPGLRWTFRGVQRRAEWCARWLHEVGIRKGDRVVTVFGQEATFVAWFLGLAQVGAIVVPINLRLAPKEAHFIASDAEPAMVLVDAAQVAWAEPFREFGVPGRWVEAPAIEDGSDVPEGLFVPSPTSETDPLVILYTSGTTGSPKGCVMSHRALLASNHNLFYTMALRPGDRYLATMPLFHIGGLGFMLGFFHAAGTTVIAGSAEAASMVDAVIGHDITFAAVPFLREFLDEVERRGCALPSLRMVSWGSQMERPETLRRVGTVLHCEWRGMFGGTETGNVGFLTSLEDELEHPGTIGRPVPGIVASVRDVDTGEPVRPGVPGELCVRGQSAMTEYWKNPQATDETIRDGWVRTGDLVRYEGETGLLFFEGRAKDMIKSGGENVFAIEVESVLLGVDGVRDVAVFGVPDPRWGEAVHAAIVVEGASAPTPHDLDARLRAELAGYKVPKQFHFVEEIPRILGKVVKRELRERVLAEHPTRDDSR